MELVSKLEEQCTETKYIQHRVRERLKGDKELLDLKWMLMNMQDTIV